jgi:hypothetical protein
VTPGDLGASFFCNSGSEAIEAAIKLARHHHAANGQGRRYGVVSLRRASHGSTVGALSVTGWSPGFQDSRRAADPMVPGVGFANAMPPYCYRCELRPTYPDCGLVCATTIEQAILGSDPELVSCVILEPVMGTAGCIVPPPGYLARVREICDRYGVALVSDEVVCGFGRTGRWFGVDHFEVVPDIVVVAKGLASGYAPWPPLSLGARSRTGSRCSSMSTPTAGTRSRQRRRWRSWGTSAGWGCSWPSSWHAAPATARTHRRGCGWTIWWLLSPGRWWRTPAGTARPRASPSVSAQDRERKACRPT